MFIRLGVRTASRLARCSRAAVLLPVFALLALLGGSAAVGQSTRSQDRDDPPPPMPRPKPRATPPKPSAADEQDEVVRIASRLVVVPVSVTDAQGQPVLNLKASDFRLEEQGRPQEIARIGDPDQIPLDIALLLDVSSSVSARFDFEQQSAARFLKQVLKDSDRATIFAIDDHPILEEPLTTADKAIERLKGIPAAKGPTPTAFYDTVTAAARYLQQKSSPQHRRVIVVISDGEDNFSDSIRATAIAMRQGRINPLAGETAQSELYRRANEQVENEVQRTDAVFYSINPSGPSLRLNKISTRAEAGMEQISASTGGASFAPEAIADLERVFRQIAAELRSQYLLQYYSKDESSPGKFLQISVRAPGFPQYRVRARRGYFTRGR